MKCLKVRVFGRVQGVGYRFFVQQHAHRLSLSGWVKNNSDATVSLLVQGDESIIEQFIGLLKKGPRLAQVDYLEIEQLQENPNLSEFNIIR